MKNTLYLLLLCCGSIFAQSETEVHVFDLAFAYEGLELLNGTNVSNNEGYDNQPSFISNNVLIFSANKDGQTDILEYNLSTKTQTWVNLTTEGSEFSPQQFPNSNDIAAVRLDKNGKQGLYRYKAGKDTSEELFPDIQVAYFAFYDDEKILATVLSGEEMDLALLNIKTKEIDTLLQNAGRSLQKVPKTNSMAYTLINEDENLDLYVMDMDSGDSFFICELPFGTQDFVWLNDTQILTGIGNKLYLYDTLGLPEWNRVASLSEYNIDSISRLAISQDGKRLAVVAEEL